MSTMTDTIGTNLKSVTERINSACKRSGRTPEDVDLIAVTKTVGVDEMRTLAEFGVGNFGENRVQVATPKYDELKPELPNSCWHLIGNLQRNKVKYIVERFDKFHALDGLALAEELDKRLADVGRKMDVLIEVNVSGEESKHGVTPDNLPEFVEKVLVMENLNLKGLMTMAPYYAEPEDTRPVFAGLSSLKEKIAEQFGILETFTELSMGMTNDFEVAIEEGATMVRIGSALFEGLY